MPKKVSKFVRIAVEGGTTDGRTIERQWIKDMAESYDPKTYGARVNCEHIKSVMPDSVFRGYGDVLALSTEEVEILGVKRLALTAQIEGHDELVRLSADGQKVYFSAEVAPNFSDSGKAYLTGLAMTDNPASLGTEMLKFAAGADKNPLASRKANKDSLFTESIENTLEFEAKEETPSADSLIEKFTAAIMSLGKPKAEEKPAPEPEAPTIDTAFATSIATELGKQIHGLFTEQNKTIDQLKTDLQTANKNFTDFKATLDDTPAAGNPRKQATGGEGDAKTDC